MYNELPRKVYKTVNGLMNNEIFKKELELIMVVRELQVTYSDDESKQTERFNMATVLVKAEDGKHYKIQVQNDRSELDEDMNDKQYVIKEVEYLDIRMIGGWQKTDYRGNKIVAIYDYYRPKGKGKHKVKIQKGKGNTVKIGDYGAIEVVSNNIYVNSYGKLTTKINGREMNVYDLIEMASARGLRPNYLNTFEL